MTLTMQRRKQMSTGFKWADVLTVVLPGRGLGFAKKLLGDLVYHFPQTALR
jgi:hypothetical protein